MLKKKIGIVSKLLQLEECFKVKGTLYKKRSIIIKKILTMNGKITKVLIISLISNYNKIIKRARK